MSVIKSRRSLCRLSRPEGACVSYQDQKELVSVVKTRRRVVSVIKTRPEDQKKGCAIVNIIWMRTNRVKA